MYPKYAKVLLLIALMIGFLPQSALSVLANDTAQSFTTLDLYPNIETIGVLLSGTNLPKNAELYYRRNDEATWHTGHSLMLIDDGRLAGSLFELLPSTIYSIKIIEGTTEISGEIRTQAENLQFLPTTILHVDANAEPSGNGTVDAPFQSIQEGVNHATPGTQVLVADGIYHEAVQFMRSGSAENWIQVKAEGNGAILDGAEVLSGDIWEKHSKSKVWFKKVDYFFRYFARDGQRFFNYANYADMLDDTNGEGWYLDSSTMKLYIRSQNKPSKSIWQMAKQDIAFDINNQNWLWIEGFEMQFYNKRGVMAENASHIIIRKNKIHNLQVGVHVNWTDGAERGNDTRIEYNEIYDPPVNEWAWEDVKGSSMEGTGIVIRGHRGAIVRGNEIHNFFNGIYTGSSAQSQINDAELAFDVDVYENHIYLISDDALEPEGACINHRFRDNVIDSVFVGVSLAPVTIGPTWVLRSTFANYTERGIKWAYNSDGRVLIYHNTFWTQAQDIAAMDFITPAHNAVLRNNIFENSGYAIYEVRTGSSTQDWDYNNWHSAHAPIIKWENRSYATLTEFCTTTKLDCNSHTEVSGLENPNTGDFTLNSSSANIDRGVLIHGINDDFYDTAPDIGANEWRPASTPTSTPENTATPPPPAVETPAIDQKSPSVNAILRSSLNPTSAETVVFTVGFSENVQGVDIDDFSLHTTGNIKDANITSISGADNVYKITVKTGKRSGTLRLDLSNNGTIFDQAGNPLDSNFNTGDEYTVNKNILDLLLDFLMSLWQSE